MKKVELPLKYIHLIHNVVYVVVIVVMIVCWSITIKSLIDKHTPEIATVEKEEAALPIVETHILTDAELSRLYTCKESDGEETTLQLTQKEAMMLMKLAKAEAGNSDAMAQAYVMQTIINRVNSELFPNTIKEVLYQKNPTQFSTVTNGTYDSAEPDSNSHIALYLLETHQVDCEALYFEADWLENSWQSRNKELLFSYEGTVFYK